MISGEDHGQDGRRTDPKIQLLDDYIHAPESLLA